MVELLEKLESINNNCIEVSIPLTNVLEECLIEVKHNDDFTVGYILMVSNYVINYYVKATGTTYLNTLNNSQIFALRDALEEVNVISIIEKAEKEFELFCKKAFDLIR